jgi:CheY-like chemotaxis protein
MVEALGYHVDIAVDGRQAVALWERYPYAAILMDCQMPEVDGITATTLIRQREASRPSTPIIAVTAHALPAERERCLAAGMNDFLTKPVTVAALAAVLSRCLVPARSLPTTETILAQPVEVLNRTMLQTLRALMASRDPLALAQLIDTFLHSAWGHFTTLRAAAVQGDTALLATTVHTLKGTAVTLGVTGVVQACAALEDQVQAGKLTQVPEAVQHLETVLAQACTALEAEKNIA